MFFSVPDTNVSILLGLWKCSPADVCLFSGRQTEKTDEWSSWRKRTAAEEEVVIRRNFTFSQCQQASNSWQRRLSPQGRGGGWSCALRRTVWLLRCHHGWRGHHELGEVDIISYRPERYYEGNGNITWEKNVLTRPLVPSIQYYLQSSVLNISGNLRSERRSSFWSDARRSLWLLEFVKMIGTRSFPDRYMQRITNDMTYRRHQPCYSSHVQCNTIQSRLRTILNTAVVWSSAGFTLAVGFKKMKTKFHWIKVKSW